MCAGSAIRAAVNGTTVAEAQDDAFTAGQFVVYVGSHDDAGSPADGRLDNLVIVQR
jgi:hypothetical protein